MASKGKKRFKAPQAPQAQPNMMQQLQEMQSQMAQAQASLAEQIVTASVGGGRVTIEMTGSQELKSINISRGGRPRRR
jgi:DNA-binding protein YbaB